MESHKRLLTIVAYLENPYVQENVGVQALTGLSIMIRNPNFL